MPNEIAIKNKKIRASIEYRLWRKAVFARDNWTCQRTGIRGCKLVTHHISNFSSFPELRFEIDNGITLSKNSHKDFHHIYGTKNNTQEQLNEFLKDGYTGGFYLYIEEQLKLYEHWEKSEEESLYYQKITYPIYKNTDIIPKPEDYKFEYTSSLNK